MSYKIEVILGDDVSEEKANIIQDEISDLVGNRGYNVVTVAVLPAEEEQDDDESVPAGVEGGY